MSILDKIVARKRQELETLEDIIYPERCSADFSRLFLNAKCLIAELKSASPSEGVIVADFKPQEQALRYIEGGADAISILTDKDFFNGSFDILKTVRQQTDIILLCKEFIIDAKQVRMARFCGADMVLLIVKILNDNDLLSLKNEIEKWGMKALIEVQNDDELQRALQVAPELLLINNRNLSSFEVDMNTTENLLEAIPDDIRVIAGSGIKNPVDLKGFSLRVDGFLIGTSLMRSDNPAQFLRDCREY